MRMTIIGDDDDDVDCDEDGDDAAGHGDSISFRRLLLFNAAACVHRSSHARFLVQAAPVEAPAALDELPEERWEAALFVHGSSHSAFELHRRTLGPTFLAV